MASFSKVSIMAFFLLACGVFLLTPAQAFGTSEQEFDLISKRSSNNNEDIIVPGEKLLHKLDACIKELGENCGSKFFRRIFIGQKHEIPASCCQKLVDMGKECHDTITDSIISRPEFIGKANLYERRAENAWNMCSD